MLNAIRILRTIITFSEKLLFRLRFLAIVTHSFDLNSLQQYLSSRAKGFVVR